LTTKREAKSFTVPCAEKRGGGGPPTEPLKITLCDEIYWHSVFHDRSGQPGNDPDSPETIAIGALIQIKIQIQIKQE